MDILNSSLKNKIKFLSKLAFKCNRGRTESCILGGMCGISQEDRLDRINTLSEEVLNIIIINHFKCIEDRKRNINYGSNNS